MPLELSISDRQKTGLAPFLRHHLLMAHELVRPPLAELSIALVDSRTIARLHQQFMQIVGPTDVLTFELDHTARGKATAGEVIVCVPFARKTARMIGVSLKHELLLYCLHGMLHLCGYDDRTQRGFSRMHRKEDDILSTLGIGPVFNLGAVGKSTRKQGTLR